MDTKAQVVDVKSARSVEIPIELQGSAPARFTPKVEVALSAAVGGDRKQEVMKLVCMELDSKVPGTSAVLPAHVLEALVIDRLAKLDADAAVERMAKSKQKGNSSPGLERFATEAECTKFLLSEQGFKGRKFRQILQGQTANGEWVNVPGYETPFAVYAAGNKKDSKSGEEIKYGHMRDEVQSKLIANDGTEIGICSIVAVHLHTPWRK